MEIMFSSSRMSFVSARRAVSSPISRRVSTKVGSLLKPLLEGTSMISELPRSRWFLSHCAAAPDASLNFLNSSVSLLV